MNERELNPPEVAGEELYLPDPLKPFQYVNFHFVDVYDCKLEYKAVIGGVTAYCTFDAVLASRSRVGRLASFDELRKVSGAEFQVMKSKLKIIAEWSQEYADSIFNDAVDARINDLYPHFCVAT